MNIETLAQKTTKQGDVTAVWLDKDDDNIVVQYEFLHISFYKPNFKSFVDTLIEAKNKLEE